MHSYRFISRTDSRHEAYWISVPNPGVYLLEDTSEVRKVAFSPAALHRISCSCVGSLLSVAPFSCVFSIALFLGFIPVYTVCFSDLPKSNATQFPFQKCRAGTSLGSRTQRRSKFKHCCSHALLAVVAAAVIFKTKLSIRSLKSAKRSAWSLLPYHSIRYNLFRLSRFCFLAFVMIFSSWRAFCSSLGYTSQSSYNSINIVT